MTQNNQFVCFGKFIRTHGIKGNIVLECYFEEPETFTSQLYIQNGENYQPFECEISGYLKNDCLILKCHGFNSIEESTSLINKSLFVNTESLPKTDGEIYAFELLGLEVVELDTNNHIGTVVDLVNFGSGLNLEVKNSQEKLEYYVYDDTVKVDTEKGTIKLIKPVYV